MNRAEAGRALRALARRPHIPTDEERTKAATAWRAWWDGLSDEERRERVARAQLARLKKARGEHGPDTTGPGEDLEEGRA
jgi:hypothetical protein